MSLEAARTEFAPGSDAEVLVSMEIEDGWHTNSHQPTYEYLIATEVAVTSPAGWDEASVAYPAGELKSFAFADEAISVFEGVVVMVVTQPIPSSAAIGEAALEIGLTYQACDDRSCLPPVTTTETLRLNIGEEGAISAAAKSLQRTAPPDAKPGPSLLWMLVLGVLGGLILNAMPCVCRCCHSRSSAWSRAPARGGRTSSTAPWQRPPESWSRSGLWHCSPWPPRPGAGRRLGVQFQEPTFVAALAVIVVLFCLNLWGVFEVPLPGRAPRRPVRRGRGTAGHFTSGCSPP